MNQRWLLTGGTGQVGLALRRNPPSGVEIVAPPRAELDLANLPPLDLSGFAAIINCGAYTAVDQAESEPTLAHAVNARAPGRLAKVARQAGIPIIHVSTDYVFPADGKSPWHEYDSTGPVSVYGRTKLAGEQAIRDSGARHAIIRTAWVISADGHNFAKTMLRLGAERDSLRVVADQCGTPTSASDLAAALVRVTNQFTGNPEQPSGIWHCANHGETTWFGLANEIFACAEGRGLRVPRTVEAIATSAYPTPARRPSDSRLNCNRIAGDFGISLRPWQDAVDEIVAELARQEQAA